MARQPQPRRITLGGREAVALTLEEYEQLIASRRQIGGQSARVRALGQRVRQTERLLDDLETLLAATPEGCERADDDAADVTCLRCAIAALLRRHRDTAS
ncbi:MULTISPECIES: hypothetical protein [Streptomyces]|uniref:Uncharacterized protein n=1 Tax=Streptomyces koelreuteriae TaxID=2838015 RepID=A0ABX8FJF4_9ACTN|nr:MULTISPECIES: hypothetical protein [Streptomyces]QWB21242.1 hypothetical protein KJK29_00925 [Streptomyces koelreuteriae]UUA04159.1 hypothetical protein NNW98_00925 [Streptomyces koelreuteriae]UUA11785.1 hypothetical protein NNW99_00925 [Streptomyces sp. CRCS-T-1]